MEPRLNTNTSRPLVVTLVIRGFTIDDVLYVLLGLLTYLDVRPNSSKAQHVQTSVFVITGVFSVSVLLCYP